MRERTPFVGYSARASARPRLPGCPQCESAPIAGRGLGNRSPPPTSIRNPWKSHGLTWAPKAATHDHCCFGGMLGNNCGGMRAQQAGTAVHNVTSCASSPTRACCSTSAKCARPIGTERRAIRVNTARCSRPSERVASAGRAHSQRLPRLAEARLGVQPRSALA